jgi:1,2-dihydroxy-3-keto-5-methylthiopentene dioxygenase
MATIVRKPGLPDITEPSDVKKFLALRGIHYDHWPVPENSNEYCAKETLSDEEKERLLMTVNERFEYLKREHGYTTRDLVVLHPAVPGIEAMLAKFDKVHYHTDEEVRYIVDGSGVFGFSLNGEKFLVKVFKSDYIYVPRNTHHWFTLDEKKRIKAVRYFVDMSGWVPNYIEGEVAAI